MSKIKKIMGARESSSIFFLIAMFLLAGFVNPAFLKPNNLLLCLNGSIVFILISCGIAFVIINGEIDVSIGATLGMCASISAMMLRDGSSLLTAIISAVLVGTVIGVINGFGVTVLKIPSIIMTLGTNGVIRGMLYVVTGGKWVENLPYEFKAASQASISGTTTYYFAAGVVIVAISYLILRKTVFGRSFYAVGDNESGANLIGISVCRTKMISFILCSVFASVGGIIYASRVGFVTPTAGNGYEMKAIAACVIGGISLSGGVGSMIGAAVGSVIMASISRILVFLQFSSDYDNTITGILLIAIVVFDAIIQKKAVERARRERLSARLVSVGGGQSNE